MRNLLLPLLLLSGLSSTGCQAYANAANGFLNSGLVEVVDGDIEVVNTMSIPLCGATMVNDKEPGRKKNDLHGAPNTPLLPGAKGTVSIPHVGDASKETPEGLEWKLKVFGCHERTAYSREQGELVVTLPVKAKSGATVHIR